MLVRNLGISLCSLCRICKGDDLTHLCVGVPMVEMIWPKSEGSYTPKSIMASQESNQPLVDEVVEPMKSLADSTPLLWAEVPHSKVLLISSIDSSGLGGILVS